MAASGSAQQYIADTTEKHKYATRERSLRIASPVTLSAVYSIGTCCTLA